MGIDDIIEVAKNEEQAKPITREPAREKVSIDLEEYVILRQKAKDLDGLLGCVFDTLEYSTILDDLVLDHIRIKEYIHAVYPIGYNTILEAERNGVNDRNTEVNE